MNFFVHILKHLNLVPTPLIDTQPQIVRARALLVANHLGLFHEIEDSGSGLSADEAAKKISISPTGAAVLLQSLAATGYLKQAQGRYRNGRWVKRWIVHPTLGLSNYLRLQLFIWDQMSHLQERLEAGKPAVDTHEQYVAEHSPQQEIYTLAMQELSTLLLPEFLRKVRLPRNAQTLLDIGGAHGAYAQELVRRHPGLKATIFDLPGPIETARALLEKHGNPQALELRAGDALQDDLGSDWDAVLLANLVHIFDPQQNAHLFRRIFRALGQQGMLIIMDQFTGLRGPRNTLPSLLSLNHFNLGGRCYSIDETKQLLSDAGFRRIRIKHFAPWRSGVLIEGRK